MNILVSKLLMELQHLPTPTHAGDTFQMRLVEPLPDICGMSAAEASVVAPNRTLTFTAVPIKLYRCGYSYNWLEWEVEI